MAKTINTELETSNTTYTPSIDTIEKVTDTHDGFIDYGLTTEEILDVNAIKVTISDPCPIVIFFGARTSGKTMTLVRLTRYLLSQGYKVEPDKVFRGANSTTYQAMCEKFNDTITSDNAATGTSVIGFMLVTVRDKNGRPICQLLEAPGEHYFDAKNKTAQFPRYINEILAMKNRRTWVFIVERNWEESSIRNAYANKIISMQNIIPVSDKVIFTCHKADLSPGLFSDGRPNIQQFRNDIKNQYPGIFSRYTNNNPITSLWAPYRFEFTVFSAGSFNKLANGKDQSYTPGPDFYPANLWGKIKKAVSGSWF